MCATPLYESSREHLIECAMIVSYPPPPFIFILAIFSLLKVSSPSKITIKLNWLPYLCLLMHIFAIRIIRLMAKTSVIFCMWFPGRVGIRGNEAAKKAAEEALKKESIDDLIPFSDLKPLTTKYIHQVWQKEWDEATIVSNKLHDILPKLSDKLLTFCNTRKEDTVLNRLHIDHSYFTHSFLLKEDEPPVCVAFNTTITVKHILIECADLVELERNILKRDLCIHCSEI